MLPRVHVLPKRPLASFTLPCCFGRWYERAPLLPVPASFSWPPSFSVTKFSTSCWLTPLNVLVSEYDTRWSPRRPPRRPRQRRMTMAVCSFLRVKGLNSPWNMCHWGWSSLNVLIELHAASIHMPAFSEQSMNLITSPKTCYEHVSHWESNSLMVDSKLVFLWTQRFFALESLKVLVLGVGNVIEHPFSWDSNMLRMMRHMTMLSASTLTHVSNSVTMCSITSHSSFGPNCIDEIRICMLNQQTNHWIDFVGTIFFRNYCSADIEYQKGSNPKFLWYHFKDLKIDRMDQSTELSGYINKFIRAYCQQQNLHHLGTMSSLWQFHGLLMDNAH